jgi:putative methylase
MRLKQLETALSSLTREFPSAKVDLEQYPTSAHLAACVIQLAVDHNDLGPNRTCCDLGVGTGMLAIGAALVGTDVVYAIDCDEDALLLATENAEHVDVEGTIQFLKAKVRTRRRRDDAGGTSINTDRTKSSNKRGGRGRGRGQGGRGRGSQPAELTKSVLIMDDKDGIPLRNKCVE